MKSKLDILELFNNPELQPAYLNFDLDERILNSKAIRNRDVATQKSFENTSLNETITHVEEALTEIKKSDFSAARLHLKAVRASAATVTGNEAVITEATNGVIQSQISPKLLIQFQIF